MVYAHGLTLVVETVHRAANWAQVPGEVRVLDCAVLDEQGLGEAIRSALASAREGVDPDDFPLEPRYAAFGARSWRSFVRGVSGACVNELVHEIKAMPLLNRGDASFDFDVDRARTLPLDAADTEIGAAVAAALTMAEPPFDLRDPEAQDPAHASRDPAVLPPVPDACDDGDEDDDLIAEVRGTAEQAAQALNETGYAADFSLASLAKVDRFFEDELRRPGKPRRRGALADDVGAKLLAIGGYVGETFAPPCRRRSGSTSSGRRRTRCRCACSTARCPGPCAASWIASRWGPRPVTRLRRRACR